MRFVEKTFSKLPIVKIFYSSIKDLVGAFVGDKKTFDRPVIVTLDPSTDVKTLGFITREALDFLKLKDHIAVYFPQSYNFAGELKLPASRARKTSRSRRNRSDEVPRIRRGIGW